MEQICPIVFEVSEQDIKVYFQKFYMHVDMYVVCGKLLELHFSASLSSNCGETVLECMKIAWYQNLKLSTYVLPTYNITLQDHY